MFSYSWNSLDSILPASAENTGGLYLGNIGAAEDVKNLKKLNIKAVLTVAAGTSFMKYDKETVENHKVIPAEDFESFDLSVFFEQAIDFIEENLKKTNVLVHCFAGVSRSSSIVIAFLMRKNAWKFEETLKFVRERRKCAYPNSSFGKQLKEFEKKLGFC